MGNSEAYIHGYQLPALIERGLNSQNASIILWNQDGTPAFIVNPDSDFKYSLYQGSRLLFTKDATEFYSPGVVGGASVSLQDTDTADLSLGDRYLERWSGILSARDVNFTRPVYVVRYVANAVIVDEDLYSLHSDLADLRDPDQTSYTRQRSDAWVILQKWLIQKGNRPYLIMDDWQLRDVHRFLSLEIIFRDFATSVGDGRYADLATQYHAQAIEEFDRLNFRYDYDEDGGIDPGETKAANPVTFLTTPWGWNA